MKVNVLYRPDSDQARPVEEFIHELKRVHDINVQILDLNTRDGITMASLYDIMQSPAVFVTQDDGRIAQLWVGLPLPLMSEVASYLVG